MSLARAVSMIILKVWPGLKGAAQAPLWDALVTSSTICHHYCVNKNYCTQFIGPLPAGLQLSDISMAGGSVNVL